MPRHPFLAAAATALISLPAASGCGTTPTTPRRSASASPATPAPGLPAPSLPTPDDPQARAVIQQTVAAVKALPGFTLDMPWMQKQGAKVARGRYTVAGKTPRTTRIEIVEGNNVGTRVLYTGGTTARVRAGGLLGAIPLSLPITDDRLKSLRGYTIKETDLTGLMAQLGHPAHRARLLPGPAARPRVEVSGGPLLPGCVRVIAELDAQTHLPLLFQAFDARECVFSMEFRTMRVRPDVSTDL